MVRGVSSAACSNGVHDFSPTRCRDGCVLQIALDNVGGRRWTPQFLTKCSGPKPTVQERSQTKRGEEIEASCSKTGAQGAVGCEICLSPCSVRCWVVSQETHPYMVSQRRRRKVLARSIEIKLPEVGRMFGRMSLSVRADGRTVLLRDTQLDTCAQAHKTRTTSDRLLF